MKKYAYLTLSLIAGLFGHLRADYQAKDFSSILGMEGFSDDLLKMHFKLYEGYVKNSNLLISQLEELTSKGQDRTPQYAGLKRMFGWEFDGMRLHELYFGNMGGKEAQLNAGSLSKALEVNFGSYDKWKQDFIATGLMRGIGWVVLYQDPVSGKLFNTWINEHDVGHLAGGTPLLVMDVFEHAYITQYGLDRAKYIDAFFKNINWKAVEERFSSKK